MTVIGLPTKSPEVVPANRPLPLPKGWRIQSQEPNFITYGASLAYYPIEALSVVFGAEAYNEKTSPPNLCKTDNQRSEHDPSDHLGWYTIQPWLHQTQCRGRSDHDSGIHT